MNKARKVVLIVWAALTLVCTIGAASSVPGDTRRQRFENPYAELQSTVIAWLGLTMVLGVVFYLVGTKPSPSAALGGALNEEETK